MHIDIIKVCYSPKNTQKIVFKSNIKICIKIASTCFGALTSSSSSSMALHLWYSLGLLNNVIPFKAILDLSCPFYKFHLFQGIPDVIFPSGLGPSYWSSCEWLPFVCFLYSTSFRLSTYVSKPTQSLGFNIIYYIPVFY